MRTNRGVFEMPLRSLRGNSGVTVIIEDSGRVISLTQLSFAGAARGMCRDCAINGILPSCLPFRALHELVFLCCSAPLARLHFLAARVSCRTGGVRTTCMNLIFALLRPLSCLKFLAARVIAAEQGESGPLRPKHIDAAFQRVDPARKFVGDRRKRLL